MFLHPVYLTQYHPVEQSNGGNLAASLTWLIPRQHTVSSSKYGHGKLWIFVSAGHHNKNKIILQQQQGCARPVFACWDWDSVYPVSIFDTETKTFKIGIKFWDRDWDLYICLKSWDWYWDFCPGYQKLRLRLRPWSVSNIETDTDTFDFKNKMITLYDPEHTF